MDKTTPVVAFVVGAAIGSAVTWFITKKHYERLAQEEIDSVKDVFSKRYSKSEEKPELFDEPCNDISDDEGVVVEDPSMLKTEETDEYFNIASEYGVSPSDRVIDIMSIEERIDAKPIIITPDEYGEIFEYDQIELTYYADGILADERDIITNIEDIVGADFAEHFGEYEDDSVYVRNDRLRSEYAILLDERSFYDVYKEITPENHD